MSGRASVSRRARLGWLAAAALVLASAPPAAAQQDTLRPPPGVSLATRYSSRGRPALAVRPFAAATVLDTLAVSVRSIIENDLRISDRFEMRPVPASLARGAPDYIEWNRLNLVWLVTGELTAVATGFRIRLQLHDIVFGVAKRSADFDLPLRTSSDFRMAVHRVSDQIVRWIFDQPGMAASRIAFVRLNPNGSYDLLTVDSDGQDVRQVFGLDVSIYSPTWSPDGDRIVYSVRQVEGWALYERDIRTGETRELHRDLGLILTPEYSADGARILFATWPEGGAEIQSMDVRTGVQRQITNSAQDNLHPTLSPDGRRFAFESSRTGRQHIYVASATGGVATVLSPFAERAKYSAPDWSPTSSQVAFNGESLGSVHIMLADADRPGLPILQLTTDGWNEDPSWAPDGRHLVFTRSSAIGQPAELYVLDTITGTLRRLASVGGRIRTADWSRSIAPSRGGGSGR